MKTLIIDDNPLICRYLKKIVLHSDFSTADTVHSGEDALVQVAREEYDFITLDLKMPDGLNGLEILQPLRKKAPRAIIAIITGFLPPEIPYESLRLADTVILKPLDVEIVSKLFHLACEVHQIRKHIAELGVLSTGAGVP